MALYAKGSSTTMNDIINVFVLGSSPTVTGRVVVPAGETEPCVSFSGRGTVAPKRRSTDNDVYLFFNRPFWSSIFGNGGRSIRDQKNREGQSPIRNAWIATGCASGIPQDLDRKSANKLSEGFIASLRQAKE
ncbi:hypothetical protein BHM03_00045837 [Ensete ventricosum]|nr:hypothetical protein BHM03_00045837 [Ensete ventricosum]